MRKTIILFLILGLFFISACSSDLEMEDKENTQESIEEIESIDDAIEKAEDAAQELGVDNETTNEIVNEISEIVEDNNITKEEVEDLKDKAEEINEEEGITDSIDDIGAEFNDEGAIVIDAGSLNTPQDIGEDPGIDVWCIPGEEFESDSEYGSSTGEVMGPTTFKDEEYCEATAFVDLNGLELNITHYYNYGKTDTWIVTNIMGNQVEQRIITE